MVEIADGAKPRRLAIKVFVIVKQNLAYSLFLRAQIAREGPNEA